MTSLGNIIGNILSNNQSQGIPQERDLGFGRRVDDTQKGLGFFGKIPLPEQPDGKTGFASELAFTTSINDQEALIPLLVPGLNQEQIERLLNSEGLEGIEDIIQNAHDFAIQRQKEGKPFFATFDEEGKTQIPQEQK